MRRAQGPKSGQSASLVPDPTPPTYLRYITTLCQLQTQCCRVHLEAARGERSHTPSDWRLLASPSKTQTLKQILTPDKWGWTAAQAFLSFFSFFFVFFFLRSPCHPPTHHIILVSSLLFLAFYPRQCPLSRRGTCRPRLSTPLRCVSPGAPRARSLSMESTRDTRWALPFCEVVPSSGQRQ